MALKIIILQKRLSIQIQHTEQPTPHNLLLPTPIDDLTENITPPKYPDHSRLAQPQPNSKLEDRR
ncbi:7930_t:CDS:2 [Gigaspora rosea]|nr:7930_t:CDS:2 [Gigaspora rosea]